MNIEKLESSKDSLKSIGQRLSAPSPLFFKRIMKVCAGIIATTGAVLLLPVTLPITIPSALATICSHTIIAATIALGVAKTGVDWTAVEIIKEEESE